MNKISKIVSLTLLMSWNVGYAQILNISSLPINAQTLNGGVSLLTGVGGRFLNGDPLQVLGGLGSLGFEALNPEVGLGLLTGTALPLLGVVSPVLITLTENPEEAISYLLNDGGIFVPNFVNLPGGIPLVTSPLIEGGFALPGL